MAGGWREPTHLARVGAASTIHTCRSAHGPVSTRVLNRPRGGSSMTSATRCGRAAAALRVRPVARDLLRQGLGNRKRSPRDRDECWSYCPSRFRVHWVASECGGRLSPSAIRPTTDFGLVICQPASNVLPARVAVAVTVEHRSGLVQCVLDGKCCGHTRALIPISTPRPLKPCGVGLRTDEIRHSSPPYQDLDQAGQLGSSAQPQYR